MTSQQHQLFGYTTESEDVVIRRLSRRVQRFVETLQSLPSTERSPQAKGVPPPPTFPKSGEESTGQNLVFRPEAPEFGPSEFDEDTPTNVSFVRTESEHEPEALPPLSTSLPPPPLSSPSLNSAAFAPPPPPSSLETLHPSPVQAQAQPKGASSSSLPPVPQVSLQESRASAEAAVLSVKPRPLPSVPPALVKKSKASESGESLQRSAVGSQEARLAAVPPKPAPSRLESTTQRAAPSVLSSPSPSVAAVSSATSTPSLKKKARSFPAESTAGFTGAPLSEKAESARSPSLGWGSGPLVTVLVLISVVIFAVGLLYWFLGFDKFIY